MSEIRISRDDDVMDVVDKVSAALSEHNLQLQDDGQSHDGYNVLDLKRKFSRNDVEFIQVVRTAALPLPTVVNQGSVPNPGG